MLKITKLISCTIGGILPITLLFSNQIEKNKILNQMVNVSFEFINPRVDDLELFFDYPFSYNINQGTLLATNQRDLKKLLKKLRKNFKKDYSHSEWKKLDVKLLNDEIAIVNAMYSRINKKGQTYFTGAAMYSFRKNNDKWKVFSITPLKPYNYFDFN